MPASRTSRRNHPAPESDGTMRRLEEMCLSSGLGSSTAPFIRTLRRRIATSPDPSLVASSLLRYLEASFHPTQMLHDLERYEVLRETLIELFGASRFFAAALIRDPELFRWLTATTVLERPKSRESFLADAAGSMAPFGSPDRKINALKRFQRREFLRIGARDLLGLADLASVTAELSDLAGAILRTTGELMWTEVAKRFGAAPQTAWTILGLGKLGGHELNYASDIDIIAVFDEEGELPGGTATYGEFFIRFVERVVQTLTEATEEGYFYRVDTRLKPDGRSGPLARSFAGMMTYYESRGELWERQMLLKARPVAGDEEFGGRFLAALSPFIYPKTFLTSPLEEISRIKARIEETTDKENIKLRPGGIRDVEFVVQALLLLNAGRNPSLKKAGTLEAIDALRKAGLLSETEGRSLESAYRFLRAVEHRLQMVDYEQTHSLPEGMKERAIVAARLKLSLPQFEKQLKTHLGAVRKIFNEVFSRDLAGAPSVVEQVAAAKEDAPAVAEFCARYHLTNRREAVRRIRRMMYGTGLAGLKEYTEQTRTLFLRSADAFFTEISGTIDPDRALEHCEKMIGAYPSVDTLYKLLGEEHVRRALVTAAARSAYLTRVISHHPEFLEMLMTGSAPPDSPDNLWLFKSRSEIFALVRLLLGIIDERAFFSALSETALTILSVLVRDEMQRLKSPPRFCVIALGKLGGEEINLGSDLDVLFLFEGKKADAVRSERLASRIIERCGEQPEGGLLYEVDARLRPEGRNAPLAVEVSAYFTYLRERSSLWERQSLTRARFAGGDEKLGASVLHTIHEFVYSSPLPAGWKRAVREMRTKTEHRARASTAKRTDIKLDSGGLLDVEFAIQVLQLGRGKDAFKSTNCYELLEMYRNAGIRRAERLADNYRTLRRLETALRAGLDSQTPALPADPGQLDYLGKWMGWQGGTELIRKVETMMRENRTLFEETVTG